MAKETIMMTIFGQGENGAVMGRAELKSAMNKYLAKGYDYKIVPGEKDNTIVVVIEPEKNDTSS